MSNTHLQVIHSSERTSKRLRKLFAKLGTKEHPRGQVLSAYRVARKAIKPELKSRHRSASGEILKQLRYTVDHAITETLMDAAEIGADQADAEIGAYALAGMSYGNIQAQPIESGVSAVISRLDAQIKAAEAIIAAGGDAALIVGDSGRVGLLSPAPVVREGAKWTTTVAMLSLMGIIDIAAGDSDFQRQAVAGIDERTTDCCLRAHGQVQPIGKPFVLTGTPRFADRLEHTPFHWYCRTSIALVSVEMVDDEITGSMREAAKLEIDARAKTGERVEIHPANAFSRR